MAKAEHPDDKWKKFSEQGEDDTIINKEQSTSDRSTEEEIAATNEENNNDDALTAITMERDTLKDQLARADAKMANLIQRNERDVSNAHKFGSEKCQIMICLPNFFMPNFVYCIRASHRV